MPQLAGRYAIMPTLSEVAFCSQEGLHARPGTRRYRPQERLASRSRTVVGSHATGAPDAGQNVYYTIMICVRTRSNCESTASCRGSFEEIWTGTQMVRCVRAQRTTRHSHPDKDGENLIVLPHRRRRRRRRRLCRRRWWRSPGMQTYTMGRSNCRSLPHPRQLHTTSQRCTSWFQGHYADTDRAPKLSDSPSYGPTDHAECRRPLSPTTRPIAAVGRLLEA